MLCQYLISLLFFIVILILSLPYIKPFLAMLLLIHKILHCLTPDFPSVSFPAPSPPSPLHLVTWVFFFFGSSESSCQRQSEQTDKRKPKQRRIKLAITFYLRHWGPSTSYRQCREPHYILLLTQ